MGEIISIFVSAVLIENIILSQFLGICREVLGTGALKIANLITGETITTITIFPSDYAISLLVQPAGAFLMLGLGVAVVSAIMNSIENKKALKAKEEAAKAKAAAAANK